VKSAPLGTTEILMTDRKDPLGNVSSALVMTTSSPVVGKVMEEFNVFARRAGQDRTVTLEVGKIIQLTFLYTWGNQTLYSLTVSVLCSTYFSCLAAYLHVLLVPIGGLMMELVPLRVIATPGTRTTFTCAYRSNERLTIEFEAISSGEPTSTMSRRDLLSDYVARYSWGASRKWTVVLQDHHSMVACRVRNGQGVTVGQLHALISKGASLTCSPAF
jgi:hypothetical protein